MLRVIVCLQASLIKDVVAHIQNTSEGINAGRAWRSVDSKAAISHRSITSRCILGDDSWDEVEQRSARHRSETGVGLR